MSRNSQTIAKSDDYPSLPLISIIVPVFKTEKYLERCLNSLEKQTYDNIEIILVEDGSPDNSGEICDKYAEKDNRIIVYHKENGGLSAARNFGIDHSSGEYITFVDSDDFVDDDYVSYLYSLIEKYQVKMSICQHRVCYEGGKTVEKHLHGDELLASKICLERMLYHDVIDTSAWAKLYQRELFEDITFPEGKLFEDIGTIYKLMIKCDFIGVGYETKYNYVNRKDSIVNDEFQMSKLDLLEMTDSMRDDVIKIYPDLATAAQRRCVYARFSTLNQMLGLNDHKEIKDELILYIKKNKNIILNNKKAPLRDKIGVLTLLLGYPVYCLFWRVYLMINTSGK